MLDYIEYIKNNSLGEIKTNKTFKDITTLKIGGSIALLFYPSTIEDFIIFYKYYLKKKNFPIVIIGNGSNILASSDDFKGIVISFKKIVYKYSLIKNIVTVSSGVLISDLINFLKCNNLSGLEQLYYIPATVGGLLKMNGSAYGSAISDNLIYIKVIDEKGNIKVIKKEELEFSYRKTNINNSYIIIESSFYLYSKDKNIIDLELKKIVKDRKNKQPLNTNNAGSTFKNPKDNFAWKLIENAGLKGYSINDAQVSNKHSNFLINKNDCNSYEMIELINHIKTKIYQENNIKLECEWNFINFKKSVYFF